MIKLFVKNSEEKAIPDCFVTVGWATGRASGLQNVVCWLVGVNNLTGALHVYL